MSESSDRVGTKKRHGLGHTKEDGNSIYNSLFLLRLPRVFCIKNHSGFASVWYHWEGLASRMVMIGRSCFGSQCVGEGQ